MNYLILCCLFYFTQSTLIPTNKFIIQNDDSEFMLFENYTTTNFTIKNVTTTTDIRYYDNFIIIIEFPVIIVINFDDPTTELQYELPIETNNYWITSNGNLVIFNNSSALYFEDFLFNLAHKREIGFKNIKVVDLPKDKVVKMILKQTIKSAGDNIYIVKNNSIHLFIHDEVNNTFFYYVFSNNFLNEDSYSISPLVVGYIFINKNNTLEFCLYAISELCYKISLDTSEKIKGFVIHSDGKVAYHSDGKLFIMSMIENNLPVKPKLTHIIPMQIKRIIKNYKFHKNISELSNSSFSEYTEIINSHDTNIILVSFIGLLLIISLLSFVLYFIYSQNRITNLKIQLSLYKKNIKMKLLSPTPRKYFKEVNECKIPLTDDNFYE